MAKTRDDFSAKTTETLAKRVAYRCSNPQCGRLTIAPSLDKVDKATIIGIAAHITAASEGGPRFDGTITTDARVSIENGIWLCANCSILIDREPQTFPVDLLRGWKRQTEENVRREFEAQPARVDTGQVQVVQPPIVEGELTWTTSSKRNLGVSDKNDPSQPIYIMDVIYHNLLEWNYSLLIVNNSQSMAYNIAVNINRKDVAVSGAPAKINSLVPLGTIEMQLKYTKRIESTGTIASDMINSTFPEELNGTEITISYLDEQRNEYSHVVRISASK